MFDMKKVGNGLSDRSQNMGPNCGIVLDFLDRRDSVCGLFGSFVS